MIHSKFIRLYKTITVSERRLLKKWLYSPMHNQRQDVQKMFEFLFSRENLSQRTLQKERTFAYVFPKEIYDMTVINHLMSYAFKILEQFIEYLELVLDQKSKQKNKVLAYSKRNLIQPALQTLDKSHQILQTKTPRNGNYHLHAYELEELRFELEGTQHRTKESNLPQLFQHLSSFFIITTLRYACIAASHVNVYKTEYDIPMLEMVLKQVEEMEQTPVVEIYYYAYKALSESEQENYYKKLKKAFEAHGQLLPPKERREILLLTINYSIKRSHGGQLFYIQEALDLYKLGLEENILLEDGNLSQFAYKNIVALGLKLKDFDWTEQFIKTYSQYLPLDLQQTYQHYVLAKWNFAMKQYDECMRLLTQVDYADLFMNIDAKMMLLKIYYEQQIFEALEALTHSFTQFLQRKDVLSYHKKNYLNIIRLTKKILHLPSFDTLTKQKIKEEITTTEPLTEQLWLLEQLERV